MGPIPGSAVREGASSSTNWASSCSQDRAFGTQCFSTSRDKAQSLARDLKSRHCRGRRRSCKRIGYGGHSIPSAFPPGNTSTVRRGRPSSPTQRVDAVTAVQLRAVQMPGGTVGQLVATNQPGRLHPGPGIRHQEPLHEVSRVREVSRVGQPPPRRAHLPIRGDVEPRADLYVLGAGARVDLAVGSLRPQDDVRGQRWWPLAEVVAHVDLLGQKLEVLIASASKCDRDCPSAYPRRTAAGAVRRAGRSRWRRRVHRDRDGDGSRAPLHHRRPQRGRRASRADSFSGPSPK